MAYHHFSSIDTVTRTLAFFLKPGGTLLVLDMIKPKNANGTEETERHVVPEHVRHIVPHTHAFSEDDVRLVYQNAGLEDFTFKNTGSLNMGGQEVALFIAKGTKR
jgi:ubiquinone/menaquinone biosynthesis C-methylase UbiE